MHTVEVHVNAGILLVSAVTWIHKLCWHLSVEPLQDDTMLQYRLMHHCERNTDIEIFCFPFNQKILVYQFIAHIKVFVCCWLISWVILFAVTCTVQQKTIASELISLLFEPISPATSLEANHQPHVMDLVHLVQLLYKHICLLHVGVPFGSWLSVQLWKNKTKKHFLYYTLRCVAQTHGMLERSVHRPKFHCEHS